MNTVEMIDLDDPTEPVIWTGSIADFLAGNEEMSAAELAPLFRSGVMLAGGGAATLYCVRFVDRAAEDAA